MTMQLAQLAHTIGRSSYGEYLLELLRETDRGVPADVAARSRIGRSSLWRSTTSGK